LIIIKIWEEKRTKRRKLVLSVCGIVATLILGTLGYNNLAIADTTWTKVGQGNFKSVQLKSESYLVSDREDFTNVDGKRRFGFKAFDGLKLNQEEFVEIKPEVVELEFDSANGKQTFKNLKIKGEIVSSEVEMIKSPDGSKILFDLPEGVWISESDGGNLRNIALNGKEEFNNHLDKARSQHDHNPDEGTTGQEPSVNPYEPLTNHGMTVWWSIQAKWAIGFCLCLIAMYFRTKRIQAFGPWIYKETM
jgi:hypothetical protein